MRKFQLKYYAFLPLLLLCVFYAYRAIDFPVHDFSNYYFGGKFLAEGNFNFKIYFPYEFNKAISNLGHHNIFASYAPNTPFLALLFAPFSVLSVVVAKVIFNLISIGLFVFGIYRLFSYYKIDPKFAVLIPVLFCVPIKNSLLFGQVYFLLFFLLAEGWLAYERERFKSMALFWGLAILLKVFPVLLLLLLIFKKQWKPFFYLGLGCLLLFGVSMVFTGLDVWVFYLKTVLPKSSNGEIATAYVDNYQSVFMFLKRLFIYDAIENPHPFFHVDSWFFPLMLAFKILILTIGFFVSKRSAKMFFAFSYWILAMILLSPYGSTYTFILLLFPFFALLSSVISNVKKIVFCVFLFLIGNLPLSVFIDNIYPFSYLRLFLSIVFAVAFVVFMFERPVMIKAIILGCIAFIVGTFAEPPLHPKDTNLLAAGSPILIYDYKVEINPHSKSYYLIANAWDGKEKVIFWKPRIQVFRPLNLKNNQVFYNNHQLTFDNSNKIKPKLIDNKTIIYLSDYGRGIGFYTLRKIDLIGK
jgi:hypothetical protein